MIQCLEYRFAFIFVLFCICLDVLQIQKEVFLGDRMFCPKEIQEEKSSPPFGTGVVVVVVVVVFEWEGTKS